VLCPFRVKRSNTVPTISLTSVRSSELESTPAVHRGLVPKVLSDRWPSAL